MAMAGLKAAVILHRVILSNILKCPCSFFDVTPKGRILARFSNDLETIDSRIIMSFRQWIMCVLRVCEKFQFFKTFF